MESLVSTPFDPSSEGWSIVSGSGSGFVELVGPYWHKSGPDGVRFGLLVGAQHLNIQGRTHGGMLATYFDNALGWAVMDATGRVPCVTVQLGVQFIAGGKHGDFIEARTRIVRKTRSLVFAEGSLFVGDTEIATAAGVWKIINDPTPKLQPAV